MERTADAITCPRCLSRLETSRPRPGRRAMVACLVAGALVAAGYGGFHMWKKWDSLPPAPPTYGSLLHRAKDGARRGKPRPELYSEAIAMLPEMPEVENRVELLGVLELQATLQSCEEVELPLPQRIDPAAPELSPDRLVRYHAEDSWASRLALYLHLNGLHNLTSDVEIAGVAALQAVMVAELTNAPVVLTDLETAVRRLEESGHVTPVTRILRDELNVRRASANLFKRYLAQGDAGLAMRYAARPEASPTLAEQVEVQLMVVAGQSPEARKKARETIAPLARPLLQAASEASDDQPGRAWDTLQPTLPLDSSLVSDRALRLVVRLARATEAWERVIEASERIRWPSPEDHLMWALALDHQSSPDASKHYSEYVRLRPEAPDHHWVHRRLKGAPRPLLMHVYTAQKRIIVGRGLTSKDMPILYLFSAQDLNWSPNITLSYRPRRRVRVSVTFKPGHENEPFWLSYTSAAVAVSWPAERYLPHRYLIVPVGELDKGAVRDAGGVSLGRIGGDLVVISDAACGMDIPYIPAMGAGPGEWSVEALSGLQRWPREVLLSYAEAPEATVVGSALGLLLAGLPEG